MTVLIIFLVNWAMPAVLFSYLADRDGKRVWVVLLATLLFGWLGALLSWWLQSGESPASRTAAHDAELERQREAAALRALGKVPSPHGGEEMTRERREKLESLLGGRRKGTR